MLQLILGWLASWFWTPKNKCEQCWCEATQICEWDHDNGEAAITKQLCVYHAVTSLSAALRQHSFKKGRTLTWRRRSLKPNGSMPVDMTITDGAELRREEQEEIDAGLKSLGLQTRGVCEIRRLGPDAQPVYYGQLDLAAGQILLESAAPGALPKELGDITRVRVFAFELSSLRLGMYSSAELAYLKPDVYDCDKLDGSKPKVFQVLTTSGWYPKPREDVTVYLSTR